MIPERVRRLARLGLRAAVAAVVVVVLAAVALFAATRGPHEVRRTVDQDPTLPRVAVGGRLFHAETHGPANAPVVLVLHGGPGNDYRYLLALEALSDHYRVAFYDQRGTGLSARVDPSELTLETMLADLDAMVDHFGAGSPVHLVGHSWGAMLASAYVGRHPEKLAGVVLAEPGILTTEKARAFEAIFRNGLSLRLVPYATLSFFRALHVEGPDEQARMDFFFQDLATSGPPELHPLRGYFCDPRDARRITAWRYGWRASMDIPNAARNARGEMELNLVAGVERLPRPILFLCGECNSLIGAAYQQDHLRYFPTARLQVIPRAGHSMFTDNPGESVAAVRRYLDELTGGGGSAAHP